MLLRCRLLQFLWVLAFGLGFLLGLLVHLHLELLLRQLLIMEFLLVKHLLLHELLLLIVILGIGVVLILFNLLLTTLNLHLVRIIVIILIVTRFFLLLLLLEHADMISVEVILVDDLRQLLLRDLRELVWIAVIFIFEELQQDHLVHFFRCIVLVIIVLWFLRRLRCLLWVVLLVPLTAKKHL